MDTTKDTYLTDLFINEAKPALNRHSVGGAVDPLIQKREVLRYLIESKNHNVTYLFAYYNGDDELSDLLEYDMTANSTSFERLFSQCQKKNFPILNTNKASTMASVFNYAQNIEVMPMWNTSSTTNVSYMFSSAVRLRTVPELDFRNVTTTTGLFNDCTNLTECWIKNIKANLQVGSGSTYGHKLTVESLIHLVYQLRDTGSMKNLTVGTANLEKLTNVYVRTIDITDEMRAEDDLVDEKLPFEVCDSTDEGATLITDYAVFKNWQIA